MAQVTVGTTATKIIAAKPGNDNSYLVKHRESGEVVFLGDSSVTTSSGFSLEEDDELEVELGSNEEMWGIVASGSVVVEVL